MQVEAELVAADSAVTNQRISGRERAVAKLEGGRGERMIPQWQIEGPAAMECATAELEGGGGERTTPR